MKLSDFCTAFSSNAGVFITLTDTLGDEIIRFNAGGYEGVESDILARNVQKIKIESSTAITVSVAEGSGA